ncbi:hypothetical protein Ancab_037582 [Ancistrocladus abbreviatus]
MYGCQPLSEVMESCRPHVAKGCEDIQETLAAISRLSCQLVNKKLGIMEGSLNSKEDGSNSCRKTARDDAAVHFILLQLDILTVFLSIVVVSHLEEEVCTLIFLELKGVEPIQILHGLMETWAIIGHLSFLCREISCVEGKEGLGGGLVSGADLRVQSVWRVV